MPKEKTVPRNLDELTSGYQEVSHTPEQLYKYFDHILEEKWQHDMKMINDGYQPSEMQFISLDHHL